MKRIVNPYKGLRNFDDGFMKPTIHFVEFINFSFFTVQMAMLNEYSIDRSQCVDSYEQID
jgi:hypothetical protein